MHLAGFCFVYVGIPRPTKAPKARNTHEVLRNKLGILYRLSYKCRAVFFKCIFSTVSLNRLCYLSGYTSCVNTNHYNISFAAYLPFQLRMLPQDETLGVFDGYFYFCCSIGFPRRVLTPLTRFR